jgi:hypothetical protein
MGFKGLAAGLCVLVVAAAAWAIPPADAAPRKKRVVTNTERDVRARTRARTRVRVQPQSFLDAGTNVVPGERKFTDYAFPPGYGPGSVPGGVVTNYGNGRPGWDIWPGFNPAGPYW